MDSKQVITGSMEMVAASAGPTLALSEDENRTIDERTAYHEAGHAVVVVELLQGSLGYIELFDLMGWCNSKCVKFGRL
jgi:hypothetical protein